MKDIVIDPATSDTELKIKASIDDSAGRSGRHMSMGAGIGTSNNYSEKSFQDYPGNITIRGGDITRISEHILSFLRGEVEAGRLTSSLLPIQSGVGSVANAVLYGLCESEFSNLTCYTEVIQDSMLELIRCGKAVSASTGTAPIILTITDINGTRMAV